MDWLRQIIKMGMRPFVEPPSTHESMDDTYRAKRARVRWRRRITERDRQGWFPALPIRALAGPC